MLAFYVWQPWLSIAGLALDIVGAFLLAGVVIRAPKIRLKAGATYRDLGYKENSSFIREMRKDAKMACWGVGILILGFAFQIVGNWPG